MAEIEFYDVKSKSKFKTTDFRVEKKVSTSKKSGKEVTRFFAVCKSPTGTHECWRVLSKADGEKYMK